MKKLSVFLLVFSLLLLPVYASEFHDLTITTPFVNSNIIGGICLKNGQAYLDVIRTSEALGSIVFECSEEKSYFILSRDGDVATHTLGTDFFELNGEKHSSSTASFMDSSGNIYMPAEIIEKIFCVSLTGTKIVREMHNNFYNNLVSNLLNYSLCGDFYPENFSRYFNFYCVNPEMDAGVVINSVNIGLDKKYFDQAVVTEEPYSKIVLVNKLNRLPDDFTPLDLVVVDQKYTTYDGRSYLMDKEAHSKFTEMYDAAQKEGLTLRIVSSYRTFEYQDNLFKSYVRRNGIEYAEKYSAHPGYSEHHTGLSVDINSVYTSFERSKEYKWLKSNAHKFGFIERYKKGQEYITGYAYEPWHYRYVGTEAAKIIFEQDITFEEYYAVYVYDSRYSIDKDRVWANVLQKYHK